LAGRLSWAAAATASSVHAMKRHILSIRTVK